MKFESNQFFRWCLSLLLSSFIFDFYQLNCTNLDRVTRLSVFKISLQKSKQLKMTFCDKCPSEWMSCSFLFFSLLFYKTRKIMSHRLFSSLFHMHSMQINSFAYLGCCCFTLAHHFIDFSSWEARRKKT